MSMRRIFLLVMLLLLKAFSVLAQKLIPEFELASSDLTAQLQPRKDTNDKNCALVKVQFVGEVLDVEGNVVSPLGKHNNEVWVYMPQNSRQIKVITKNFLPIMVTFADFGVEKLEGNRTYVLVLNQNGNTVQATEPITQSTVQQKPTTTSLSSGTSGSTITIPVKDGISIEMVKVEAGTFMMGHTAEMEGTGFDSKPSHKVTLTNNYYMGKYEVTQKIWNAIMGLNPSKVKGDYLPVSNVSWTDCQKFINKLNNITGRNFRLPTEAEWEFAARGGNNSKKYRYSGSNVLSDVAWFGEINKDSPHLVGSKKSNELGIFDMSGNVYEWCSDWYENFSEYSHTDPIGAVVGTKRVIKGGGWTVPQQRCQPSDRLDAYPILELKIAGFRLALSE